MIRRALGAALLGLSIGVPAAAQDHAPITPAEHRRTPDQTFLTFPEWYLVHSPAEYAAYLAQAPHPSAFPLFAHIGQFWQSYAAVTRAIARWPFNAGYHLMVMVIGTSTTVEYTLKGVYEHTVGRLAEATKSSLEPVPEERFAARYAQSYVDFIRIDPWYRYDFGAELKQLWRDVPLRGPNLLRRWERRYMLTSELLVKAGYAQLIGLGTRTVYDAPKPTTAVLLSRRPVADPGPDADVVLLAPPQADGAVLAMLPRYQAFTGSAAWVASQGIDFVEVAGNRGDVLVSAWAPADWQPAHGRVLFRQPFLTRPGTDRVVFALPVAQLAAQLRAAAATPAVALEHVYDF